MESSAYPMGGVRPRPLVSMLRLTMRPGVAEDESAFAAGVGRHFPIFSRLSRLSEFHASVSLFTASPLHLTILFICSLHLASNGSSSSHHQVQTHGTNKSAVDFSIDAVRILDKEAATPQCPTALLLTIFLQVASRCCLDEDRDQRRHH
nr:hypothetical protein Iba_chr14bCG6990 [Ipomoea batatas]